MARKLSRRAQARIKKNLAYLEGINTLADSISEEAITDLVRRDAIGVGRDGFPGNSMPEYSSGGGFSGSSTENAALYGLGHDKSGKDDWDRRDQRLSSSDEVRRQLTLIESNLRESFRLLKEASGALNYVTSKTEGVRGRVASTPCEICAVQAAQKSGWCHKDYEQWIEDGKPDRALYAMWLRKDKNSEGLPLVAVKPEPKVKT